MDLSLRQSLIHRRKMVSPQLAANAAKSVAALLFQTDFYQNSHRVACYLSVNQELDTRLIIAHLLGSNKLLYLPRLSNEKGVMDFVHYCKGDPLIKNRYGIFEPISCDREVVKSKELDLVLAPLLAFDSVGHRVGMGAGYYDRALASKSEKPFYCGLAYAFQKIERLTPKAWDISLDAVITEAGLINF